MTVSTFPTKTGIGGGISASDIGTGLAIDSNGKLSLAYPQPRNVTGGTDIILAADSGGEINYNNATAVAATIAAANTTGFQLGFCVTINNWGLGVVTLTPASPSLVGLFLQTTLKIQPYTSVFLYSDGTNYPIDISGSNNNVYFSPNGDESSTKAGIGALAAMLGTSKNNSAFGGGANNRLTTGVQWSSFGAEAGYFATTENYGCAFGFQALRGGGGQSCAFGVGALKNTTNLNNVGIGFNAGQNCSTGQDNVFIGANTAALATGGNSNIIIGSSVNLTASGASLELNIGNQIIGKRSKPSISSGFGTSPSVPLGSGTFAFTVNVGTGGSATAGIVNMGMTAPNGWMADITNLTSGASLTAELTANSTTTITISSFSRTTGLLTAFNSGDILLVKGMAY